MAARSIKNHAKDTTSSTSYKAHRPARGHFQDGANARSFQDQGLGGRGDIANKEQGLGKNKGKKNNGRGRARNKASIVAKDLRKIERNLGARH